MARRRGRGEGTLFFDQVRSRWVGQIVLPNGKRKSKTAKSRKEVLDWLTTQKSAVLKGTYVTDDKLTLGDFLDRYLEDVAKHSVRPKTFSTYKGYVDNHVKVELGKIKLASLRPDHVQAFYSKKLADGLSTRTVEQMHAILHKALKQALRWGLVNRNVTDLVSAPRPKRNPRQLWSVNQVNTFLKATETHPYYPIYLLAVYCGMRQSEILGIHREDVDLERGIINVRHTLQRVQGQGLIIQNVKSQKSKRAVVVPSTALKALRIHLVNVERGLIFTTSKGTPVDARELVRHFKKVINEVGLPDTRFHDLRHLHATLLLASGANPKVVQERLGHSTAAFTLNTYASVLPGLQEKAAADFEKMMASDIIEP